MVKVTINVDSVNILDRAFDRFADEVKDWQPAWEQVGEFMYEHEDRVFSSRGFGTWAPLAKGGDATLVDTGAMKASLTSKGGDNVMKTTKDSLLFGSRVNADGAPYPLFHQRGTVKMPQRQVIFFREEDKRELMKIMQRYAVEIVKAVAKKAGGKASVSGQ